MGILSLVGCSASGERLVSAARDGDLQEAQALLECNPRLARYSTFGRRNSPLHYAAEQGHHEIVMLLLESGVDINLRNFRGQTALMQACRYGFWEVVQALMLFYADIHRADFTNGFTALHFAAVNGHARCVRLILVDYVPSRSDFWENMRSRSVDELCIQDFDHNALVKVVNQKANGGLTALHIAASNGHVDCVQLLLDLGADVTEVTVDDGTTLDLLGAGSTPLHYAASGGNAVCCQLLLSRGACVIAKNEHGMTPLMVAQAWHRTWLEEILCDEREAQFHTPPSPYLSLPLMSAMNIARECGWRDPNQSSACIDPCSVCLERSCSVAVEGCNHEFCTRCALYLCSTNSTSAISSNAPGAIPCPLCRHPIVSFIALPGTSPPREPPRASLSLSLCTACPAVASNSPISLSSQTCRADAVAPPAASNQPLPGSPSIQRCPPMRLHPSFCMGMLDTAPCLIRCSRPVLSRSPSLGDGSSPRSLPFPLEHATTAAGTG